MLKVVWHNIDLAIIDMTDMDLAVICVAPTIAKYIIYLFAPRCHLLQIDVSNPKSNCLKYSLGHIKRGNTINELGQHENFEFKPN